MLNLFKKNLIKNNILKRNFYINSKIWLPIMSNNDISIKNIEDLNIKENRPNQTYITYISFDNMIQDKYELNTKEIKEIKNLTRSVETYNYLIKFQNKKCLTCISQTELLTFESAEKKFY